MWHFCHKLLNLLINISICNTDRRLRSLFFFFSAVNCHWKMSLNFLIRIFVSEEIINIFFFFPWFSRLSNNSSPRRITRPLLFLLQPSWMRSREYWDDSFEARYAELRKDPTRPPLKVIISSLTSSSTICDIIAPRSY